MYYPSRKERFSICVLSWYTCLRPASPSGERRLTRSARRPVQVSLRGNHLKMLTFYVLYIVLLFVTVVIGVALAAYVWRHRHTPGAMAFAGLMLGTALMSFSLAMLAFTNSPEAADFWGRRVRFISNTMMSALLLVFVIQYTGREKWLSWPRLALLFSVPVISLVLTWSGEAHYLFVHLSTGKVGPFTFLGKATSTGPWNVVYLTYSYLTMCFSLVLLLLQIFRTKFPYRGQAILLFVGGLFPFLATVPDTFMAAGPRPSLAPFGVAALGLVYAWALFRYRLFDIVPIARDRVIESMTDAVLVLDERHRLVDVNPAAQALMGRKHSELIGRPIAAVLPAWSRLAAHPDHVMRAETVMDTGGGARHIALREQPILERGGHRAGYLIVLRDITERRQAEEALKRQAEELAILNRIAHIVATLTDLPQALQAVAEIVASQFSATASAIVMWGAGQMEILAWFNRDQRDSGMVGGFLPMPIAPVIREPLDRGETISFADIQAVPLPPELEDLFRMRDLRALLVAPLRVRGTAFGSLTVATDEAGRTFSPDEVSLVETIAADVAAAIENARLYEQAQELAVSRERQRLARDLHDSVTQTLYSVALTAEALPRVWAKHPDQAQAALNNLHRLARGALGEMRTLLFELQPAMLLEKGPEELLRQLAHATMGRTQAMVEIRVQGERALPNEVRIALYWIAQEALNNVTKHAEASQVIVELELGPEQVVLDIKDDGRGFDPETAPRVGFGARNMAYRAKEIGAAFSLQSHPRQGTQIQVVWPEHPPEHPGGV
jgi:PAS domain S-box-containing protein